MDPIRAPKRGPLLTSVMYLTAFAPENELFTWTCAVVRVGARALVEELGQRGVLVFAFTEDSLRFVTHLGLGAEDVSLLETAMQEILGG